MRDDGICVDKGYALEARKVGSREAKKFDGAIRGNRGKKIEQEEGAGGHQDTGG